MDAKEAREKMVKRRNMPIYPVSGRCPTCDKPLGEIQEQCPTCGQKIRMNRYDETDHTINRFNGEWIKLKQELTKIEENGTYPELEEFYKDLIEALSNGMTKLEIKRGYIKGGSNNDKKKN